MSRTPGQIAAGRRQAIHRAIAHSDIESLRAALNELYDPQASPLLDTGGVGRPEAYAPVVEALILACAKALCDDDDEAQDVRDEMQLNVKHTYKSFGITQDEFETITRQLDEMEEGSDESDEEGDSTTRMTQMIRMIQNRVWCEGTCLKGLVKPARHAKLFEKKIN